MDRAQAGILMLGSGIAIVELWRRGLLNDLIGSIVKPPERPRPFALPTAPRDIFLGPEAI